MSDFKVIPAIDLMDGQCVRLVQGDYRHRTTYPQDPMELARLFLGTGLDWLHVVDLDGARTGRPENLTVVEALATTGIGIELGGGIRTGDDIQAALDNGARQVILGSSLTDSREELSGWLGSFPGRLIAGVDARNSLVAVHGWQETTSIPARELITQLEEMGFERVIYTDIATDGTLTGPNLVQLETVAGSTRMEVTASGGISSVADIQAVAGLAKLGVTGVIVGKAFYDGRITLEELAACQDNQPTP